MQPVIIHDSRNTVFRYPFGAVEAGSSVALRCEVEGDGTEKVMLRLWIDGAGESLLKMEEESWQRKETKKRPVEEEKKNVGVGPEVKSDDAGSVSFAAAGNTPVVPRKKRMYHCTFPVPDKGCLLWYYFKIETAEKTYYYGNNMEQLGGWGQLYEEECTIVPIQRQTLCIASRRLE